MENILVKPKNKKQSNIIRSLFKEMDIPFKEEESLEAKIFRLYEEKHYNDEELEWFFSIPKKYRVDPFETTDDGDIFWADQRNIDQTIKDIEQAKKDKVEGNYTLLETQEELEAFFNSL